MDAARRVALSKECREALLKEYSEVGSNFRLLTDIRFKLLGFLPIAAAAAAAIKDDSLGTIRLPLSLFGLVTTLGVATYNARNTQFYNELVERAASIERQLGIPDGYFANRPRAWLNMPLLGWPVDHGTGITLIYAASIALWLFGVLAPLMEFARHLPASALDVVKPVGSAKVANILAGILAIVLTVLGILVVGNHKRRQTNELRILAIKAVKKATGLSPASVAKDEELLCWCWKLSGEKTQAPIKLRAEFYAGLDTPVSIGYYIPSGSSVYAAAHMVALLTDLSPLRLFDWATDRRGQMPTASTGAKNWFEWFFILGSVSSVSFGFGVLLALGASAHLPVWIIGTGAAIMGGLPVAIAFQLKK